MHPGRDYAPKDQVAVRFQDREEYAQRDLSDRAVQPEGCDTVDAVFAEDLEPQTFAPPALLIHMWSLARGNTLEANSSIRGSTDSGRLFDCYMIATSTVAVRRVLRAASRQPVVAAREAAARRSPFAALLGWMCF